MPDEKDKGSNFKVVDRRLFSTDGSAREQTDEPVPGPRKVEPPAEFVSPRPENPPLEIESPDADLESEFDLGDRQEPLSGFDTLVSYLGTTVMFQLGLMAGPSGERIPADLANARQTINMLEVLDQKTAGNLTKQEHRLLDDVLYELRMAYVEVEKRISKSK